MLFEKKYENTKKYKYIWNAAVNLISREKKQNMKIPEIKCCSQHQREKKKFLRGEKAFIETVPKLLDQFHRNI